MAVKASKTPYNQRKRRAGIITPKNINASKWGVFSRSEACAVFGVLRARLCHFLTFLDILAIYHFMVIVISASFFVPFFCVFFKMS